MGKITVETCHIEGLKVITPQVFGDERGYFMETYNYNDYKAAGIDMELSRTISPVRGRESCADFISRSTIPRINWSVLSAARCMTWR